ncbi:MAG: phosphoribosylglycinamide synthetase C domain-containing protein, partial [Candidatus Electryoneaceae bacterium]|nr:phosphoribosylglycinamide synthetase C domain-containing protein [Candidatus Electryoneaceae bacterium]
MKSHDWRRISSTMSAVTVIVAMEGYPGNYQKGGEISSIPQETERVIPFHAGTALRGNELFTSGGRVFAITGIG